MDSGKNKRGREEQHDELSGGPDATAEPAKLPETTASSSVHVADVLPPPGLFEFPWQEEDPPSPEADLSWDIRRVFFSSLVDGCSADVGIPGDRFSSTVQRSLRLLEELSDGDLDDGKDCIWSFALRRPLFANG